ncbi:MAG: bacillithiol biosynthesis cysteine-adding enzyme BshC [Chryseolinea sp.]
MQLDKVSLADARAFSPFFLDYIEQKETLKPFYNRFPLLKNFGDQIKDKQQSFPSENRKALVESLRKQYDGFDISPALADNLTKLEEQKTFTITTGHQLNIFTGPLYFIFKIITVINACTKLKAEYPDYNFVPVFWMASEDHDYEEISYFKLYGQKYVWDTDQQGAVGRFNTKGLDKLADTLPGDTAIFRNAYKNQPSLAAAVRQYVNELFGKTGLIVLDADDKALKALLRSVMLPDVIDQVTRPIVDKTNDGLQSLDYKTQVYCRDINFFYLDTGIRSRIEKDGDGFKIVDTDLVFSKPEMERMIAEEPWKFSPNVILRPLYQEMILPNIAYVGGPAEVIYWLQLKGVFSHFKVPFPMLMPRNFGMILSQEIARKFKKTGLSFQNLFEDKNYLFNHWVVQHATHTLTVGKERSAISRHFEDMQSQAGAIDPTLAAFVGAEGKRALNSLERIERKMLRAEKRLHSDKLRQIESVKDSVFPNGSLQERTDNFLNFYQNDPEFIGHLMQSFDPFDFKFNLLSYSS